MLPLLCVLLCATAAHGAIVLPSIYASHMVLQAGQAGELWGTATPSAKVIVRVSSTAAPLVATASATSGRFSVTLPAKSASMSPVNITITAGADSVVLSDVLFGAVYVCSGQSNSETPITSIRVAPSPLPPQI
jgi:sialate O-acetylesterase|eukprot:COSAG01_NODE_1643_length_9640_cov_366.002725_6_plen_133_part_00